MDQRTGGYLYDARMVQGLRHRGWRVRVHELPGRFPEGDATARHALESTLTTRSRGSAVLVDGLAMGGLPDALAPHADRIRILSLVHHPLNLETGVSPVEARTFERSEADALSHCLGVITTSGHTAGQVVELGVARERVRVVPPGTDPAPRARGAAENGSVELLCVASVVPRKGHDILVEALAGLKSSVAAGWRCRCVGSLERAPDFARRVQAQAVAQGLEDRLEFTGELEPQALEAAYGQASVFVLASHHEGYGMVLTEALARGLPIVATTGGAIPDTVPDQASLLVPPGDSDALVHALVRVLKPAVREPMASAAWAAAHTLPDWDESAGRFESAIRELLQA